MNIEVEPRNCELVGNNIEVILQARGEGVDGAIAVVRMSDDSTYSERDENSFEPYVTRTLNVSGFGGSLTPVSARAAALVRSANGELVTCPVSAKEISCGGCEVNADCDDGNSCTQDICTSGICSNPFESSGTSCDDGLDFCTSGETCDGLGVCQPTGFACVASNLCNEGAGICECIDDGDCGLNFCCPDGFSGTGNSCSTTSCAGSTEICTDGLDNDGDSLFDCADVLDCPDGSFCRVGGAGGSCQSGVCDVDPTIVMRFHFEDDISDGVATDSSGNGYNGVCAGATCPAFNPTGGIFGGGSYVFDTTSNRRISVSGFPAGAINGTKGTYSIWLKKDSSWTNTPVTGYIMDTDNEFVMQWSPVTDTLSVNLEGVGAGEVFSVSSYNFPDDTWTHVAFVYDYTTTDQYFIYIDNIEMAQRTGGPITPPSDPTTFTIGNLVGGGANSWVGEMMRVEVYDQPMDSSEIAVLYSYGSP